MKKTLTLSAICMATFALFATSCKKSDDSKSRHDMLTGSWWLTQQGSDDNGNGAFDASEKNAVTGTDTSTTTFNSNGTGTISGNLSGTPISLPLQWNLQNGDNDVRLIYNFFGTPDTTIFNIQTLNGSQLLLKDPSSSPADFSEFTKK